MINPETFIEDFRKLYVESPQCGSWTRASENCDYGDITTTSKDCYMCFNSGGCEDAYYCEDSRSLTNCTDCAFCEKCELCFECVDCDGLNNSNYCQDCHNSFDIHFCYDVRRCNNCIGCVGLRDKQYCIFNEQYSKEEYEKALKDISDERTIEQINKKVEELKRKIPRMYVHQFDTTDCTGDYVYHSKNCHMCFDTRHSEDSGYIIQANLDMGARDSFDCGPIPTSMDLCYDVSYSHYMFNSNHIYWCGNSKDCEYCTNCFESENLFGCHYLKTKQDGFYILNQKVDEDYYRETTKKIKKLLEEKGIYTLHDLLYKDLSSEKVSCPDDQLNRKCTICSKEFEIVPQEIEFYKKKGIKIPIYCPDCRAKQRVDLRNDRTMYKRSCDSCKNSLISTYPPESKYIVYCLKCYWKHIN
ncbi:hypothetical protein ACFL3C_04090 [Patescibacteria group bacterium]